MSTEIARGYVGVDYDDTGVKAGLAATSAAVKQKLGGAAQAAAAELQKAEAAAARTGRAVDQAAGRIEAAKKREVAAAKRVEIAEQRVAEVRAKAGDGAARTLAAEEALRKAREGQSEASKALQKAEAAQRVSQEKAATAAANLATATKRVADEESKASRRSGTLGGKISSSLEVARTKTAGLIGGLKGVASAAGGLVAVGGVAALAGGLAGAVTAAGELEQSVGGVRAVFKGAAGDIEATSVAAANAVGLSAKAYQELVTVTGAMLKNKGLTDFAERSKQLVGVGADLAAQFGGSTREAMEAINAALRGESDPIERYGITLNEAALQAEAMSSGLVKASVDQEKLDQALLRSQLAQEKYNAAVKKFGADSTQARSAQASMLAAESALGKAKAGKVAQLTDEQKAMAALSLIQKQSADAQGAFAREAETAQGKQQRLTATLENQKATLGQQLLPAYVAVLGAASSFVGALSSMASWASQNSAWLGPLATGVGVLAGALALGATANWLFAASATGATVAGTALATVIGVLTSPITLAVAAIAGLIAAVVLLYRNNETARNIINGAWTAIRDTAVGAWSAISGAVTAGWGIVKAALDAMVGFYQVTLGPVFQWLASVGSWAFKTIGTVVGNMWRLVSVVLTAMWTAIKIKYGPVFTWLWRSVVAPAMNGLVGSVRGMWTRVKAVWDIFAGYVSNRVTPLLRAGVAAAGKAWSEIQEKVKAPVRFVIDTVVNKTLIGGYNAVVGTFGGKKIDPFPMPKGFDVGGWTGHGSKYQPAGIVHADEFVLRKETTSKIRRKKGGLAWLNRLNRNPDAALEGPGYATGGLVSALDKLNAPGYARGGLAKPWPTYVAALARRLFPGLRSVGGYGSRGNKSDHPSGNALDLMVPVDSPVGDAIAAWGIKNHAAMKLKYIIWKQRIIGSGKGGWSSWKRMGDRGSITANHRDHPHFSFVQDTMGDPSALGAKLSPEEVAALNAGGGFMINPFDAVASKVRGLLDKIPGVGTPFGQMLKGMPSKLVESVASHVTSKLGATFGGAVGAVGDAVGSGVQRWAPTVKQALQMMGEPESLLPVVLRRMRQESGGDPNAVNNWDVNARRGDPSKGLMQVIGGTFRRFAMPGYNRSITDPLSNILASMRYAKSRYGSLSRAYNRAGGYADGGLVTPTLYDTGGVLKPGLTLVSNQTRKPETIRTFEQERELQRVVESGVGGGDTHVNITVAERRVAAEVAESLRFADIARRNRGRYRKAA